METDLEQKIVSGAGIGATLVGVAGAAVGTAWVMAMVEINQTMGGVVAPRVMCGYERFAQQFGAIFIGGGPGAIAGGITGAIAGAAIGAGTYYAGKAYRSLTKK